MRDNDLPTKPEGADTTEKGIVPAEAVRTPENTLVWACYLWCIVAGALAPYSPVFTSAFVAYATCMLTVLRDPRTAETATFIGCVAAVVSSLFLGVDAVPASIVTLIAASAMGMGLGSGALTTGRLCALCGLLTLLLLGIDSSLATWAGTTLQEAALTQIDASFKALAENMSALGAGLEAARDLMRILWPTGYTVHAFACCIAAAIGVRVARQGLGERAPRDLTLTTFDLPLWVAGLLLVAIVGLALSQVAPAKDVVLAVSANLAMAVRFAFGIQGVAVAAWLLRRRGTGIVASLLICAVLVFIDMQFFVMAIVGLVDFWANIRHLERGANQVPATV